MDVDRVNRCWMTLHLPQIKNSITKAAAKKDQASFPPSVGGSKDSCSRSSSQAELISNRDWLSGVVIAVGRVLVAMLTMK
jgi:hypothetical protein